MLLGGAPDSTGGRLSSSPSGTAWQVSAAIPVQYHVRLVAGLLHPDNDVFESEAFAGSSRRRLLVVERRIVDLFGMDLCRYLRDRRLPARVIAVRTDEASKNIETALYITSVIDELGIDRRREPIVAVGGGVLLDIVGFAAALYRRGTPYIRVPTTLVGMVDAGVGVKTGINYNGHKNRLGSYHAPLLTLLDPDFLRTLPSRHLSNGLAEIAKMALMRDRRLWQLLVANPVLLTARGMGFGHRSTDDRGSGAAGEAAAVAWEVVARAVHSMLVELQPNLWEQELNRVVDFGHSVSPGMEMAALPDLLHGEAVAVDMALSCVLSANRNLLAEADLVEVLTTLIGLGLPLLHPVCTPSRLVGWLQDTVRHRDGRQRFPVPAAPGEAVFLEGITMAELTSGVRRLTDLNGQLRDEGAAQVGRFGKESVDATG